MKITEEERNEIIKLRQEGKKQKEIASLLGRSLKPIKRVLKEEGMSSALEKTITCLNCEKDYLTEREHTKFCSDGCRVSYNKKNNGTLEKECNHCGVVFRTYHQGKNFCQEECRQNYIASLPKTDTYYYLPVPKFLKMCKWCCTLFETTEKQNGEFCSTVCSSRNISSKLAEERKRKNLSIQRSCENCGKKFRSNKNTMTCSDKCMKRNWERKSITRRRARLLMNGRVDKDISLEKLFDRDEGLCYICKEKCHWEDYEINKEGYKFVGRKYPSVDHFIPVSKGGTHTWDNVKLAHHYCNSIKSDKM